MNKELKRSQVIVETEENEVLARPSRCSLDLDYEKISENVATEEKNDLLNLLYRGSNVAPTTDSEVEKTEKTVGDAYTEREIKADVADETSSSIKEINNLTNPKTSENVKEKFTFKNKVFNKKMIPFVTLYAILFVAVITLILGAVPGTGWEGNGTLFKIPDYYGNGNKSDSTVNMNNGAGSVVGGNDIYASAESDRKNYVGIINKIVTDQGIVEITKDKPVENTKEETNWFDKVCDFLSNAFGG